MGTIALSNYQFKYTNPASQLSWLLQAKNVGPSYEANEPSEKSYLWKHLMSEDEDQEEGEGEQEHVQILKGPPPGGA